jgi:hypothetical protein
MQLVSGDLSLGCLRKPHLNLVPEMPGCPIHRSLTAMSGNVKLFPATVAAASKTTLPRTLQRQRQHHHRLPFPVPHYAARHNPAVPLAFRILLMLRDKPIRSGLCRKHNKLTRMLHHIAPQTLPHRHHIIDSVHRNDLLRSGGAGIPHRPGRRLNRQSHHQRHRVQADPGPSNSHALDISYTQPHGPSPELCTPVL